MADQTPIFKFDVGIYKNDNISTADFNKYFTETYPPKAAPVMKKNGILQYSIVSCYCQHVEQTSFPTIAHGCGPQYTDAASQTLTPPEYREGNRQFIEHKLKQPEWKVPEYDAVVSYYIHDPADMGKLTADPEFQELEKDAPTIGNPRFGQLVLGHETVLFTTDAISKPKY